MTHPQEVWTDRTRPVEVWTDRTHPEEVWTDRTHPVEVWTDRTHPEEVWTDRTHPQEVWTDRTHPQEVWTDTTHPVEVWTDRTHPQGVWTDTTHPEEVWTDRTHPEEVWTDRTSSGSVDRLGIGGRGGGGGTTHLDEDADFSPCVPAKTKVKHLCNVQMHLVTGPYRHGSLSHDLDSMATKLDPKGNCWQATGTWCCLFGRKQRLSTGTCCCLSFWQEAETGHRSLICLRFWICPAQCLRVWFDSVSSNHHCRLTM